MAISVYKNGGDISFLLRLPFVQASVDFFPVYQTVARIFGGMWLFDGRAFREGANGRLFCGRSIQNAHFVVSLRQLFCG